MQVGYKYYEHQVLIPEGIDLTLYDVFSQLKADRLLARTSVVRAASDRIEIKEDGWTYHVRWETGEIVSIEAKEVAELFARERSDISAIASADARIVAHGNPDPNMDHLNTYIFIREALEAIPDLFHFDPQANSVWGGG